MKQGKKTVLNGSHWGIFRADVEDGRVVRVHPFEKDPAPTPLIHTIPSITHTETRISQPMVRAGYHANGPDSDRTKRGAEPFVKVSWDEALDLVAGELSRVKTDHGNQAIFAGSYGWGGPGKFQRAKNHLHRMLNMWGGFTGSTSSYSFAAGMIIVPHILGSLQPIWGPHTSWASLEQACGLLVSFGGLPAKNMQIDHGGSVHTAEGWLKRIKESGTEFVNIGPNRGDMANFLDALWLPARPGSDTAIMLALAHTLYAEGLHDQGFLARYCVGFEAFLPYLTGADDGQPKDADWAAPICEVDGDTIRALARRMAATRTMINISWSVQRADRGEQPFWMGAVLAAMLGQIGLPGAGISYGYGVEGSNGNPHTPLPAPGVASGQNPSGSIIPCARISDMLLEPSGEYDFNGQHLTYP
ncbi:MAG: molybdopterin-dependent oxidoreductase, partial [Rhodospirillales bacterium]|nr:molybdopterin-dependent oxidoreductase [Rhodospirillales bacterium]